VSLKDHEICGYEALARWRSPDGTTLEPEEFLPIAEASALIVDVDLSILTQALKLLKATETGHMAVNVSAPSLASSRYQERFKEILDESGVEPGRLRLEVTETALLHMTKDITKTMEMIAETGVTWYVDDFGTGYSSISHLRDLPISGLKLDKSFTQGIRQGDEKCVKLAQGLIGLAEGLGLETVAEGIESLKEEEVLQGQGWTYGQGWLYGRPGPHEAA
jgi:EAL domain-containing protein (putative c-di-GMP-specific phosphodiesterase class I)